MSLLLDIASLARREAIFRDQTRHVLLAPAKMPSPAPSLTSSSPPSDFVVAVHTTVPIAPSTYGMDGSPTVYEAYTERFGIFESRIAMEPPPHVRIRC